MPSSHADRPGGAAERGRNATRGTLHRRQAIRRTLLLLSFLAFPITMNYFSPYLIVESSFRGVVNGSLLVFGGLFVSSLVLGRAWCGWVCPAAGIQEPLLDVSSRRVGRRAAYVKWAIWVPWVATIAAGAISAGGYRFVDPLYGTVGGLSLASDGDRPLAAAFAVYFVVVGLFFGLALFAGRRAGCHTICWMAPFMIAGRRLRNTVGIIPALRLKADSSSCRGCGTCTAGCPMSIDVRRLVETGSMEHSSCALCGTCADGCPERVIGYSFSAGR